MFNLTLAPIEDSDLPRVGRLFVANLGEEGGEAVVVIHGPTVEGVVVALSALDAHTAKNLGDIFREGGWCGLGLVIVGRWFLEGSAGGGKDFADNLID